MNNETRLKSYFTQRIKDEYDLKQAVNTLKQNIKEIWGSYRRHIAEKELCANKTADYGRAAAECLRQYEMMK